MPLDEEVVPADIGGPYNDEDEKKKTDENEDKIQVPENDVSIELMNSGLIINYINGSTNFQKSVKYYESQSKEFKAIRYEVSPSQSVDYLQKNKFYNNKGEFLYVFIVIYIILRISYKFMKLARKMFKTK